MIGVKRLPPPVRIQRRFSRITSRAEFVSGSGLACWQGGSRPSSTNRQVPGCGAGGDPSARLESQRCAGPAFPCLSACQLVRREVQTSCQTDFSPIPALRRGRCASLAQSGCRDRYRIRTGLLPRGMSIAALDRRFRRGLRWLAQPSPHRHKSTQSGFKRIYPVGWMRHPSPVEHEHEHDWIGRGGVGLSRDNIRVSDPRLRQWSLPWIGQVGSLNDRTVDSACLTKHFERRTTYPLT